MINQTHLLHNLITATFALAAVTGASESIVFDRAEKSWIKSEKDFGDSSQIAGEIGDIQIATHWFAQPLKIAVPTQNGFETQDSVCAWCDEHYPGFNETARLLDIIEEVFELAAVMAADHDAIFAAARAAWSNAAPEYGNRNLIAEKVAALHQNLLQLAEHLNINPQTALDEKMSGNRARTHDESLARLQRKTAKL